MTEKIKFVVLGGSSIASPELVEALIESANRRPLVELVLYGRTLPKLELVGGICQQMVRGRDVGLEVSYTTDLEEALEGAGYILNQIRVGGLEARAFDETFPHEFGIPGEETVGPGGFNNSRRTIPVVLELCKVIERVAPNAVMLNLTNPNSVIQYAVTRYSKVRIIGVCNSPLDLSLYVAGLLDTPLEELSLDYAGMHHFGFIVGARQNGQDVMDRVLERVAEVDDLGIDLDIIQAQRAVPGSYMRYFYHSDRMLAKQIGKPARAKQLLELQGDILSAYANWTGEQKPEALAKRGAGWYAKIVVPVLLALINDTQDVAIVNVINGKTAPYLPDHAIVEVPCAIGAEGAKPLDNIATPPPDIRAMIQVNSAYEILAAEGIAEQDRARALRALLLSPLVPNANAARGILDRIWSEDAP